MKIILSSSGLSSQKLKDYFVERFGPLDGKTAGLVTSVQNEEEQFYVDASMKELEDLGIKVTEINIAKNDGFQNLPEFDIYYVCGGNTFYILYRLRKTGMDKIIIDAVKKGKLYIGVSAGSIIAGPDIEIAGLGDPNDINLQDLRGLKLTDLIITPHYQNKEEKDISDFENQRKVKVERMKDGEAIYADDEKINSLSL